MKIMNKKGDLSINIIIIAAIALIILVIMSVLLFRSGGQLRTGTSCEGVGGTCIDSYMYDSCSQYAEENYIDGILTRDRTKACPQEDQFCCMHLS